MKHFQDEDYDSMREYESGMGKHMAESAREECLWLDDED
jgi:hypothetical protein